MHQSGLDLYGQSCCSNLYATVYVLIVLQHLMPNPPEASPVAHMCCRQAGSLTVMSPSTPICLRPKTPKLLTRMGREVGKTATRQVHLSGGALLNDFSQR